MLSRFVQPGMLQALGLTPLRVVLGLIFVAHGAQKMFIMGIPGTAMFFGDLGIPAPEITASLITFLELIGGAALTAGALTRAAALLLALDMLTATVLLHLPNGFYVGNNGVEFTLLLFVACFTFIVIGPGDFSVDGMRSKRLLP
ncbi:MAG: DoxX family protein [Chloroflexi bacterium]|nr:DoxX family protein [Chloroflexota bacterium]